jgi:acyl-CoA reductase-like NAD-dependent aldehyde dehydrogenase
VALDRERLFIDGRWQPSSGSGRISVVNPFTEQVLGTVPDGTADDVERAVRAAATAFPAWAATAVATRATFVDRLADALERRCEDVARAVTLEMGMPYTEALAGQANGSVAATQSAAEHARSFPYEEAMGPSIVVREPIGVVAGITPWNTPPILVLIKVAPALAAGCTFVLKPAETAPFDSFLLADAIEEVGFPPGVFNLVSGFGPTAGEALAVNHLVDMVSFTGSTRAGRRVAELAATTVKKVTLELGGKSPNVILEDAVLDTAVRLGVTQAFSNAGQICGAWTRMIVPRARLHEVEEIAASESAKVVLGDPLDPATTMGPLANSNQWKRVQSYIEQGLEQGARLIVGGLGLPEGMTTGYFTRPTVFSDVDNDMVIAREEIFGPVLSIIPYDTEEEAVAIANDTIYGLDAAVFGSQERAEAVARRIRAGRVDINGPKFGLEAPFGGYKQSGVGRCLGRFGFEEFLQVKALQP